MPFKTRYDQVADKDDGLARNGNYSDESFEHGIQFSSKYIGTSEVMRPSSRVEIVAAMRHIRYEFKGRSMKKTKVLITISVKGIKVTAFKKKRKRSDKYVDETQAILEHPIYRIFYVSHDSQDLQIFSYISRDESTDIFRCSVFKAFKKGHAMRIVRTIGQAFDVCHKLIQVEPPHGEGDSAAVDEKEQDEQLMDRNNQPSHHHRHHIITSLSGIKQSDETAALASIAPLSLFPSAPLCNGDGGRGQGQGGVRGQGQVGGMLSSYHQMQMMFQQLNLQSQQSEFLLAQMQLLKDQLAAETAARIEAQTRTQLLLVQNRELLEHINVLVHRLFHCEMSDDNMAAAPPELLLPRKISFMMEPLITETCHVPPPERSAVPPPSTSYRNPCANEALGSGQNVSPDSGHRDMSSVDNVSVGEFVDRSSRTTTASWHTPPSQIADSSIETPSGGSLDHARPTKVVPAAAPILSFSAFDDDINALPFDSECRSECRSKVIEGQAIKMFLTSSKSCVSSSYEAEFQCEHDRDESSVGFAGRRQPVGPLSDVVVGCSDGNGSERNVAAGD